MINYIYVLIGLVVICCISFEACLKLCDYISPNKKKTKLCHILGKVAGWSCVIYIYLFFLLLEVFNDLSTEVYYPVETQAIERFVKKGEEIIVQTESGEQYTLVSDDLTLLKKEDVFCLRLNNDQYSNCFVGIKEKKREVWWKLYRVSYTDMNIVYVNQETYDVLMDIHEIDVPL